MKEILKEILIDMVLTVPATETSDTICSKFIDWVEANGWSAGGGVKDITGEE